MLSNPKKKCNFAKNLIFKADNCFQRDNLFSPLRGDTQVVS